MVTHSATYLATDTFPAIVIESTFSFWVGICRYLVILVGICTHEPQWYADVVMRSSFATSSGNISMARHETLLLTIPLKLDFVKVIKFSENHLGKTQMVYSNRE